MRDRSLLDQFVRLLALALVVGGLYGAITSLLLVRDSWVWHMPDLAYRFLAAAAASYVVGGTLVLLRPSRPAVELLLATVVIYALPLGVAILISSEQIDWGSPTTWAFIAVVSTAVIIAVAGLWRCRGQVGAERGMPLRPALRVYLLVLGIAALALGALVFATPRDAGWIWPWSDLAAWTPLDTRLTATMLLTIGAGALLCVWLDDRTATLLFLPMLWTYCVVASVGLALHAADAPALRTEDMVYIAVLLFIALDTVVLAWLPVRRAPAPAAA